MCLFIMNSTDFMTYLGFNGLSSLLPATEPQESVVLRGDYNSLLQLSLGWPKEESTDGGSLQIKIKFKRFNHFIYLFILHLWCTMWWKNIKDIF